jgi:hypothetical protein
MTVRFAANASSINLDMIASATPRPHAREHKDV